MEEELEPQPGNAIRREGRIDYHEHPRYHVIYRFCANMIDCTAVMYKDGIPVASIQQPQPLVQIQSHARQYIEDDEIK